MLFNRLKVGSGRPNLCVRLAIFPERPFVFNLLCTLRVVIAIYKVRAYGLCIMVDHVHELLQASERGNLESFERELNSRFAKQEHCASA